MVKYLLILLMLTGCGGGGTTGGSIEKGTYQNPYEECTYTSIQEYWDSGVWCKVIWTEKDWDGNPKKIKHINLSYVGSGDDECGPDSTKVCRAYTGNNVLEDGPLVDVVERGEDEDDE